MDGFLINLGRKKTILVSVCILFTSLTQVLFLVNYKYKLAPYYQERLNDSIILEVISFTIYTLLLVLTYKGKLWAKQVVMFLLLIDIFLSFKYLGQAIHYLGNYNFNPALLLLTVFIFSISVIFFCFSKSFKIFSKYQKSL